MAMSAATADGGIALTAVIARRKKDGKLVFLKADADSPGGLHEELLDESSDRALDLYERLKKSKGEGGKYSEATLFLRSKSRRGRTKFS
jgi:hypothetical protein